MRLRRDRVVVVLEHKIYVYNFADLKILHQTDTVANPLGLCALSPTQDSTVMACPGLNKGQVRVELYDLGVTKFIARTTGSSPSCNSPWTARCSRPPRRRGRSYASTTRRRRR